MEPEYEQLLSWEDPGPTVPGAAAAEPDKPWGDRIVVSGPSQPLKGRQSVSLMADSYGFWSQEELLRVQKYLRDHGGLMGLCPTHIVCAHYYQTILLPEPAKLQSVVLALIRSLYKECTHCLCESSGMDALQLS